MARKSTRQIREATQLSRRKARIRAAIERESLGPHPEQATIRWEARVYIPGERTYIRLPGMHLEVLVGSDEELQWVREAMVWGIEHWLKKEEDRNEQ